MITHLRDSASRASILALLIGALGLGCFAHTARGDDGETTRRSLRARALWGQVLSSQLQRVLPVSFWTIQMDGPVVERLGLQVALRFDSPVIGSPESPLSLLIQPGRTDYSIAFAVIPPDSRLGAEYHHVSGHAVSALTDETQNEFEEIIKEGGASNLVSLTLDAFGAHLQGGYGSLWSDTNTAPILLQLDGILLNTRVSRGPFLALRVPGFARGGLSGRLGALAMWDREALGPSSGDYYAWGAAVTRPVSERLSLGASYMANNGYVGDVGGMSMVTVHLQLRWGEFGP